MAISVATIGGIAVTTNAAAYTIATTRAPTANTLVLVSISATSTTAINNPSSVSGAGMVFSLVTNVNYNTIATPLAGFSVWRGMTATPNTSNISIAFTGSKTGCIAFVHEFSGVSTSGTSGANAVGASLISSINAASSVTLLGLSFASTANAAWVGCDINLNATTDAPNSQYIEIGQGAHASPTHGNSSGWTSSSAVTQCFFSGAGSADRGALFVEIVAAPATPGSGAGYQEYYRSLFVA